MASAYSETTMALTSLAAAASASSAVPVAAASSAPLAPLQPSPPGAAAVHFPLAEPGDEEWLTPVHCFIRGYCIEFFTATEDDIAAPCMGKRDPIWVNQVGIRCGFCSRPAARRQKGEAARGDNCTVFPSGIGRIYNAAHTLILRHLLGCAHVPPAVLARYEELRSNNARSGASKKYWSDSAARLGLYDTEEDGIWLNKEKHRAYLEGLKSKSAKASGGGEGSHSNPSAPLVIPSDKRDTTSFTFHLLTQLQPCAFTEADRVGKRKNTPVGHAGLACRYCLGKSGNGRFFPRSVKTMADASKTLDPVYKHVLNCESCPGDIKTGLGNLRRYHDSEKKKLPVGGWKSFFVKIYDRLHRGETDDVKVSVQDTPAADGEEEGKGKADTTARNSGTS